MLVLGWFAVLLGVCAMLWADGAFAKIDPRLAIRPKRVRSAEPYHFRRRIP
jgi:hypothetical protein